MTTIIPPTPPRSTQEALETITQERDRLLPQVEEVKWRARQLERERDTHATTAKELAQSEAALRAQLDTITNETTTQHSSLQQELEVVRREAATAREQLQAAQQRLDDEVQEHESDRQELERLVGKRDKHKQVWGGVGWVGDGVLLLVGGCV